MLNKVYKILYTRFVISLTTPTDPLIVDLPIYDGISDLTDHIKYAVAAVLTNMVQDA